uniref:Uncharacterized protein n=1 Tax=Globodera rostochiensis TaxID=31243 RepID=A0A914HXH7_GLORO
MTRGKGIGMAGTFIHQNKKKEAKIQNIRFICRPVEEIPGSEKAGRVRKSNNQFLRLKAIWRFKFPEYENYAGDRS